MNPSQSFILRPVAASLFIAGILVADLSPIGNYRFPRFRRSNIRRYKTGASPDVVASAVTTPLERKFGQVHGLHQMTSTSSSGASLVTLQFDLALNIDIAEQDVQAGSNAAETYLPPNLPNPPIYSKTDPAQAPAGQTSAAQAPGD